MDHNNLTYETIESNFRHVNRCKSLIQEFGVNIIYIKGEANVVANAFSRLPMAHHTHKLAYTTLEEDTGKIMSLDSFLISDNTDCFSLDIEKISFMLYL